MFPLEQNDRTILARLVLWLVNWPHGERWSCFSFLTLVNYKADSFLNNFHECFLKYVWFSFYKFVSTWMLFSHVKLTRWREKDYPQMPCKVFQYNQKCHTSKLLSRWDNLNTQRYQLYKWHYSQDNIFSHFNKLYSFKLRHLIM